MIVVCCGAEIRGQEVASVKGQEMTIEIVSANVVESMQASTGEMQLGAGGFNPVYKTQAASSGNVLVNVVVTLANKGTPVEVTRSEVLLQSGKAAGRGPLAWHEDLGLVRREGESIAVGEKTKIDMTFDIPQAWRSDLSMSIAGTAVGKVRISLDGEILTAATKGDAAALRGLVKAGGNVNARNGNLGETALMLAAENGHVEAVRVLLAGGADVNLKAMKALGVTQASGRQTINMMLGWTAMRAASHKGHTAVVELLKQAGATQ